MGEGPAADAQPPGGPPPYPPGPPQGAQPYHVPPHQQHAYFVPPQQSNGIAVAGGVVGIVALVTAFIPFIDLLSVILAILAIVFGAVGNGRANRLGGASKGMAITGLVCGILALVVSIVFIAAVYSVYHSAGSG